MNEDYQVKVVGDNSSKVLDNSQLLTQAIDKAMNQLMASTEFKKPRMERINKYWALYDGQVTKKLRQLFNVPIPVFPGMVDTLNAQYDTPIQLKFKEGDASDYFKVQKLNGAFQMEIMDTTENTKWDSKLRMARKHAIIGGRGILRYNVESDPEYKSELNVVNLKNFHFQPRGGNYLENHLFLGEENIEKTAKDLDNGVKSGIYDIQEVENLKSRCADNNYLPIPNDQTQSDRLARFKPLGLDPDNHNYVGEAVYKLCEWILNINGVRYYMLFQPWTRTCIRFEKWSSISSSGLYPWVSYATHEDDENFLSKSFADDLYPAADAIVAMFNQELTNREKRNFGARAYDKEMFTDVRKLDEAMTRPDALVPADTKGGTRRISEGVYEFKVGDLGGTVNLIDWITGSLGRNTGATDINQGSVTNDAKKASVAFAEQKAVTKRLSWSSASFHDMMAQLGKRYIWGLKDHMPSKMAIRMLGEFGWDWDEITKLDLDTKKDIDVMIISSDKEMQESELKNSKRQKALELVMESPNINGKKRDEEILRSIGEYTDQDIAEFLDLKTYSDKKSTAMASLCIQKILHGEKPVLWHGATVAFMQKIVDFAGDKRSSLKEKYDVLIEFALSHKDIVRTNIERKVVEDSINVNNPVTANPSVEPGENLPGGVNKAMNMAKV